MRAKMKKILFFMPDNPLKKNSGNKIRALSFLQYFKSRGFNVHFVSEYFWGEWTDDDTSEFENSNLAQTTSVLYRKPFKRNFFYYFFCYVLPNFFYQKKLSTTPTPFPELVTYRLKKAFNDILRKNDFDYIFINYASWSTLIEDNKLVKNAKIILDTHDFLTAQNQQKFKIGPSFQEEIRRLSLFDLVLAISIEEQYIFSQFCKSEIKLAPMMIEKPKENPILVSKRKFDIIYVASKNPHNIQAASWFMSLVYPLLPKSVTICMIGEITQFISKEHSNITTIPFAQDLATYYEQAKIAICPMLSGTGTKIKVIEALSYSLPIVCNLRGVDGLVNKSNNGCLVSDDPEEFKEHITTLLNDQQEYNKLSLLARQTFESNYEEENCYKKLDRLF